MFIPKVGAILLICQTKTMSPKQYYKFIVIVIKFILGILQSSKGSYSNFVSNI